MQKIISLFMRDYEGTRHVFDAVVPGAEWVLAGEGIATQKHDGTCCLVRAGRLFKRYELKQGRVAPEGFEAAQGEADPVTGDLPGWVPVGEGTEDRWHREALALLSPPWTAAPPADGTYELCGPKVQGNPEHVPNHCLVRHGSVVLDEVPRTFDGLREYFAAHDIEGIVWHHPDQRMVKLKGRDYGIRRGRPKA